MSEIIMVASGKGGAGKSTVCTMLGAALSEQGRQVLLLEMDSGLRGLDIMNGVHDSAMYDLYDVLEEGCTPSKAIVQSALGDNLYLLPASIDYRYRPGLAAFSRLVKSIAKEYDYLLIDCPAGLGKRIEACMRAATQALIVTIPELLTVRNAAAAARIFHKRELPCRLIINRVPERLKPTESIPDLDAVIDLIGAQLIGVLPEDAGLSELSSGRDRESWRWGISPKTERAFTNIAKRLQGEYVTLEIK